MGFFQPTRLAATSLASILLEELYGLVGHDPDKLIAQTYDGAAALSGIRNGVCTGVKRMELAEWLVHWAPKLASRVRCSTRSSP